VRLDDNARCPHILEILEEVVIPNRVTKRVP
jgi:hypothetical protein